MRQIFTLILLTWWTLCSHSWAHTQQKLQLQRDGDSGRKMEPEVTMLSKVRQTENFISQHGVWIFKLCTFIYASYSMCIGLENKTGVTRRKESWK